MAMQRPFLHPTLDDVTLESVLYALADPVRLSIVCKLLSGNCPMNCSSAAPIRLPKSTQSHHYQVLREAGLIRSERRGTEVVNTLRCTEIDAKFPGIIPAILAAVARGTGCAAAVETKIATITIAEGHAKD